MTISAIIIPRFIQSKPKDINYDFQESIVRQIVSWYHWVKDLTNDIFNEKINGMSIFCYINEIFARILSKTIYNLQFIAYKPCTTCVK